MQMLHTVTQKIIKYSFVLEKTQCLSLYYDHDFVARDTM